MGLDGKGARVKSDRKRGNNTQVAAIAPHARQDSHQKNRKHKPQVASIAHSRELVLGAKSVSLDGGNALVAFLVAL